MRQRVVSALSGSRYERAARIAYSNLLARTPSRLLSPDAVKSRAYDRLTIEIATRALSSGGNSIDVGAHCGFILRHLVRLSPAGQHWAFEPLPNLAAGLRRKFPAVHVEQVALSDYSGTGSLRFIPSASAYSSLLVRPDVEDGNVVRSLSVEIRRLDDVIPEGVPVRFMKIDAEGSEAAVLHGAASMLRSQRPVVVFECDPADLPDCLAAVGDSGHRVSLLADFVTGRVRSPAELLSLGNEHHEYYYVASA